MNLPLLSLLAVGSSASLGPPPFCLVTPPPRRTFSPVGGTPCTALYSSAQCQWDRHADQLAWMAPRLDVVAGEPIEVWATLQPGAGQIFGLLCYC